MQERSEAERRATWPCLNVATWRRERSDRAIQQICKPFQINQVPDPFYYIEKTIFLLKKQLKYNFGFWPFCLLFRLFCRWPFCLCFLALLSGSLFVCGPFVCAPNKLTTSIQLLKHCTAVSVYTYSCFSLARNFIHAHIFYRSLLVVDAISSYPICFSSFGSHSFSVENIM